MSQQHRVVFTPSGREGLFPTGTSVLDAARSLGVDLDSVCGGRGICGRCQVVPSLGSHPKWAIDVTSHSLDAAGATEAIYQGRRTLRDGARLGCQAGLIADVVLDVPPESQLHGPIVRKTIDVAGLELDPLTTLHVVTISPAELGEDAALAPSLIARLDAEWGLTVASVRPAVLSSLHPAVAADDGTVTAAVRRHGSTMEVAKVWGGVHLTPLGVAIDIGSTTIAGHLMDLSTGEVLATAGVMNPQIRLGEDLMSRVSYVMMNDGGDAELTSLVRDALRDLIADLASQSNCSPADMLEVVLVGNPIMHHIALGIDPTPLGQAPFVLATDDAVELVDDPLGLGCHDARIYFAPCIAGHVGADTAAAILSEGPHRGADVQLLVDVGTNAEIVLGNEQRLFAASSPTGPAFEGAQISCGQRATPGAIERVRIDRATLEPRIKVVGCDLWSNDPGFDEAVAGTGVTGVCGSGIIEVLGEMFLSGVMSHDGVIVGSHAASSDRVESDERTFAYVLHRPANAQRPVLRITQNDVRAVQLAKSALRAGIDLLLEHAELSTVDEVRLAGAFGAHIDPVYAMILGLIPDCPIESVQSVGNAAGTGAVRALLSGSQRTEMERVVRRIHKIETATEPRFQELFVSAMALPHATAETPHLAQRVELPPRPVNTTNDGARRGRRRRGRTASEEDAK